MYWIFQVFDTTRKVTYKNLPNWLKELREYRPKIPCLCCGNKIDGQNIIIKKLSYQKLYEPYNYKQQKQQSISPVLITYT